MQHLSANRLADLGDASPTADEERHLFECAKCTDERSAHVTLLRMARASRAHAGRPLSRWEGIAAELSLDRHDARPSDGSALLPMRSGIRWPMQIAAGLLLCVGGALVGRASVGTDVLPGRATARTTRASVLNPALATPLVPEAGDFASVEEARTAQERSHLLYEQATSFLARQDSSVPAESPVVYRSRLAALDRVISTTRAALREAPQDPVINDYYLTSIGQREVTLRQLNVALPASLRLNSF